MLLIESISGNKPNSDVLNNGDPEHDSKRLIEVWRPGHDDLKRPFVF